MVEEYLKYIDKQDCERKGLVRTADGKYYKRNTLERYEAKGYLDGEKYDSQQLLSAGLRLAKDFYLSRLAVVSANDVSKVRVDGCGNSNTSDSILFALDRFHDACRAVPYEFWSVISNVCCDDIDIIGEINEDSKRQKQYRTQVLLALLRLGLVRLVEHYR
jgi:hypothetical protein